MSSVWQVLFEAGFVIRCPWHSVKTLESQLCPAVIDLFCIPTYELAMLLEMCGKREWEMQCRYRGRKDENGEIIFGRNKTDGAAFFNLLSCWRKLLFIKEKNNCRTSVWNDRSETINHIVVEIIVPVVIYLFLLAWRTNCIFNVKVKQ